MLPDLFLCLFLIIFIQDWTWEKSYYYTKDCPSYEVVTVSRWKYSEDVWVKAHSIITLYVKQKCGVFFFFSNQERPWNQVCFAILLPGFDSLIQRDRSPCVSCCPGWQFKTKVFDVLWRALRRVALRPRVGWVHSQTAMPSLLCFWPTGILQWASLVQVRFLKAKDNDTNLF